MTGHVRRRGERSWELKFDAGSASGTGRRITRYSSFRRARRDMRRLKSSFEHIAEWERGNSPVRRSVIDKEAS